MAFYFCMCYSFFLSLGKNLILEFRNSNKIHKLSATWFAHLWFPLPLTCFPFSFFLSFDVFSRERSNSTTCLTGRDVSRKYLTMTTAVDYLSSFQESFIMSSPLPLLSYLGSQPLLPDFNFSQLITFIGAPGQILIHCRNLLTSVHKANYSKFS